MRLMRARWSRPAPLSRQSWDHTARKLRGPLYAAVDSGTVFHGGFGHSGSGRQMQVSVSIRHVRPDGELDIETSDEPPWGDDHYQDWRLVRDWIHRALPAHHLAFPLSITADKWEQDIPVDGVPLRFVFVGSSEVWSAIGHIGGRQVSLGASAWPANGLALVTIDAAEVSDEVPE